MSKIVLSPEDIAELHAELARERAEVEVEKMKAAAEYEDMRVSPRLWAEKMREAYADSSVFSTMTSTSSGFTPFSSSDVTWRDVEDWEVFDFNFIIPEVLFQPGSEDRLESYMIEQHDKTVRYIAEKIYKLLEWSEETSTSRETCLRATLRVAKRRR